MTLESPPTYVMVLTSRATESQFLHLRTRCLKYVGLPKGHFIHEFLHLKHMFHSLTPSSRYPWGRNHPKMASYIQALIIDNRSDLMPHSQDLLEVP